MSTSNKVIILFLIKLIKNIAMIGANVYKRRKFCIYIPGKVGWQGLPTAIIESTYSLHINDMLMK